MENRKKNFFFYIGKIFNPFDRVRKIIINILFWGIVLLFLVGLFAGERIRLPGRENALVLNIQGNVVEELSGNTLSRAIGRYNGYEMDETLLWDVLHAIDTARVDPKINAVLLDLRYLESAGLAALTEIRDALVQFRAAGKTIIAYSDYYDQSRYFLASSANEIYADPMGEFIISGFSVYNQYYGEGLERLGVDVNYFHAGKYKSYGEVFTRSNMSDEAKEANRLWSGDLWGHYVRTVSKARSMGEETFNRFIENYVRLLEEAGGNPVQAALDVSLIDGLKNRTELRNHMTEISGYSLELESFNQIFFEDYLLLRQDVLPPSGDKIAVINASGTIYNGFEAPGNIGSDSLVQLLETAQFNSDVKALVLRIDSGGGSSFASEIVRRKLEILRESGIPVIISMGSVAASGGYWIATASDEIWAQPTTITGSIGVFSLVTTFEDPLEEYLGINVDGVGTTWMAGSMRSDRDLDPGIGKIFQHSVDHVYREFLSLVAESRELSVEDVHQMAQGRVWSGLQAKDLGLVDELGGLDDAIHSAAVRTGLEEGAYSTIWIRPEIPLSDQMLATMLENTLTGPLLRESFIGRSLGGMSLTKKLSDLEALNDPSGIFALTSMIFK